MVSYKICGISLPVMLSSLKTPNYVSSFGLNRATTGRLRDVIDGSGLGGHSLSFLVLGPECLCSQPSML